MVVSFVAVSYKKDLEKHARTVTVTSLNGSLMTLEEA